MLVKSADLKIRFLSFHSSQLIAIENIVLLFVF